MKAYALPILAFLLIPALASAQKKVSLKGIDTSLTENRDVTIQADSFPGTTNADGLNLLVDQQTGQTISLYPDHMPCLIPSKTYDRMNFFKMNADEVKDRIDNMPNAIQRKKKEQKPAPENPE